MYDARAVANYILERSWDLGHDLTQIDVQKICYFLHGHHLIQHGQPLIATEFEAWEYGPVQRVLRTAFKKYGDQPILELAKAFDPIRRIEKELPPITTNSAIDTINTYLPLYLDVPSFELVEMTHREGTPWSQTMYEAETRVNVGMVIDNQMIIDRFEGIAS